MNRLPRWISFASFAAVLVLASAPARAFTDDNAEMKEAAAERGVRVVVTGKAGLPRRTVWVPPSAKSLDGFRPVFPEDRMAMAARPQRVAAAEAPASARR